MTVDWDRVLAKQNERASGDFSWVFERLPTVLPAGWLGEDGGDGGKFTKVVRRGKRLRTLMTVIVSGRVEDDGRRWFHLSVSRPTRLPSWDDLVAVKELFLGRESKAIQVIPPRSQYVNIHPHVLHLFECVDGDPLPDFTGGTASL